VRRTVKLPELKRNKELVAKTSGIIKDTLEASIQAERFSSWRRLVFTTARILQLYERYKSQQKSRELEPETLGEAKILWFKDAQKKNTDQRACEAATESTGWDDNGRKSYRALDGRNLE